MTLSELKTRCEAQGFQYAYGLFKEPVEPPYLASMLRSTNNFMADNVVYSKDIPIQLDYIYIDKDLTEQAKIEDIILQNEAWNKSDEIYIESEKVWQVSYYFNIEGE